MDYGRDSENEEEVVFMHVNVGWWRVALKQLQTFGIWPLSLSIVNFTLSISHKLDYFRTLIIYFSGPKRK